MMKSLETYSRYVRKKKREENVEKTKMMVNEWKWEGRKIEQVNEFEYPWVTHSTKEPRIRHI
jgi:homospermidine synthase